MFILVYGADGTGKSIQCKSVAEINDNPVHLSFATKNRRLYADSGIESLEIIKFDSDSNVNPYATIDNLHSTVTKIIKENTAKLVVIDEITLLRKWAGVVVLSEVNRAKQMKQQATVEKIGKENAAAWEKVNNYTYGEIERLANWSEIHDTVVIAITAITEERAMITNSEGKMSSETTGRYIIDAKLNVKKLADVIVRLEKDGARGKGYYAFFEKQQDWMLERPDFCKVDKQGLFSELLARGVLLS
jgi:broad-specificity NMP kinase